MIEEESMRTYIKVKREYVEDRLETIECDWCRTIFRDKKHQSALGRFNGVSDISSCINTFKLVWKTGLSHEGGTGITKDSVELCSICREKLKEHLKELGIRINTPERNKW